MRKTKQKKVRLSADGTPYTVWQARTRVLCIALAAWGVLEAGIGLGFFSASIIGVFHLQDFVPVGPGAMIIEGTITFLTALSGLWGAHNPRRITVFFWVTFLVALLAAWLTASMWSQGMLDLSTLVLFAIAMAFAVCAWNVRGQTGYFDNHPHPGDGDEMPIEKDVRMVREAAEKVSEEIEEVEKKLIG